VSEPYDQGRQEIATEIGQLAMRMLERLEHDFDLERMRLGAAAILVAVELEPGNVSYVWYTTASSYHEHLGLMVACTDAYRHRTDERSRGEE
jgi:hypothetical protein